MLKHTNADREKADLVYSPELKPIHNTYRTLQTYTFMSNKPHHLLRHYSTTLLADHHKDSMSIVVHNISMQQTFLYLHDFFFSCTSSIDK